jgi:phosphatidylglycerol---prolipoprotein diacylglyceryl transferase
MTIPFEPVIGGVKVNLHLVFEYLAFFAGFRYYVWQRRRLRDTISDANRLSIVLGTIFGALLGSRLVGFAEYPVLPESAGGWWALLNVKSIMGGLFGGLLGVEVTKYLIGEKQSSGDMFTLPIIIGIIVGRIGCFLAGVRDFTYGVETTFVTGMDLGDGRLRHPLALYEIMFLILLIVALRCLPPLSRKPGDVFKVFMVSYFGFRFVLEFLKPNVFLPGGLSSIQWLCILCWIYYLPSLTRWTRYAYQKVHLLRFHA